MTSARVVECPHCKVSILIDALNCGVFRCGVWSDTGVQMNPHMTEEECHAALGQIWGCSRPFQVAVDVSGVMHSVPCGYI